MIWYRICAKCNGVIYKGEGVHLQGYHINGHEFWRHKHIELCKERCNLRPKDLCRKFEP